MAVNPLISKLGIKAGQRLLVLNAPEGYFELLGALPEDSALFTDPEGEFDYVQAFVWNKADVDSVAPRAMEALVAGGLLWFSYPKKSSKITTDITRDAGWDTLTEAGMRPVSMVSIDATWSAFRFRPVADVKVRPKRGSQA